MVWGQNKETGSEYIVTGAVDNLVKAWSWCVHVCMHVRVICTCSIFLVLHFYLMYTFMYHTHHIMQE